MPAGAGGDAGGFSTGDGAAMENVERLDGFGEYKESIDGESFVGEDSGDTNLQGGRRGDKRAWFASLPEAVREAVKSRGKTIMPKGYEELLRRYFEDQE